MLLFYNYMKSSSHVVGSGLDRHQESESLIRALVTASFINTNQNTHRKCKLVDSKRHSFLFTCHVLLGFLFSSKIINNHATSQ